MGIVLGRRCSVRDTIAALEVKIEKKEKRLKELKKTHSSLFGMVCKAVIFLSLFCAASTWIFKETVSLSFILRYVFLIGALDAALVFLGTVLNKWYAYRVGSATEELETLRAAQVRNIEDLKRETKYYETHGIVKKYETSKKAEEEPEETVVEKMIGALI